jgi:signal transduction histidine kinase
VDLLKSHLCHRAFPEVAQALRSQVDAITRAWEKLVRGGLPQLDRLTLEELKDHVPTILSAIADVLASGDLARTDDLLELAARQGVDRFQQAYTVTDMIQEDRLLRGAIVVQIERALLRQMSAPEAAALHATIDVMLQQGVVALVEEQKAQLRSAAEAELKYLSFLSHDLNNNLAGVTLMLKLLRQQVSAREESDEAEVVRTLDLALQSVYDTIHGMRRLLEHERLRKSAEPPRRERVDLHALAWNLARQFEREVEREGVSLYVDAAADAVIVSDRDLIRLVLQNLVGNAVKYSGGGAVRVAVEQRGHDRWALLVSDDGPGIAPELRQTIFDAFRRGEVLGQDGVGLGLAIAAQAAKLLGAELSVESVVGRGSTFTLSLSTPRYVEREPQRLACASVSVSGIR